MCTAVTYYTKDHYFGRTFDNDISYGEKVVITPRNYSFVFRKSGKLNHHYAMIGMAVIQENYPLYYDATNEYGLSMAGLNFPGNAYYMPENSAYYASAQKDKEQIAPFELIPWILGQCKDLENAKHLLKRTDIIHIDFSEQLSLTPLHWMIADKEKSMVVESTHSGVQIYDNPVGVLTNNPTFDIQLFHLNNYRSLSIDKPKNYWPENAGLDLYSHGMGALGLPGDLSSMSRFVRAAFTKIHSVSGISESESISQFFHILGSVAQQRGCVRLDENSYELTIYTSCCNMDQGIYYYTTYGNHQITAVDMNREDLNGGRLIAYPLVQRQHVYWQN